MPKQISDLTPREQKDVILSFLIDFADHDEEGDLLSYLDHIGFDLRVIRHVKELPAAFVAKYRLKTGKYDVDRAANDLATWPPIAARIAELTEAEQKGLPNDL
ncbi:hypothetical protein SAMN05428995_101925 [Loktanella sp. DSM 29012]|uniref:Uncharacterized protein n=1 Tax=Loktanella gaetbuli TaxID=2881335 RepID=A0ABS8BX05_9RHOB|nr:MULTISPECIES: hypothetical protein [Loktanella]MCB5200248.1 hypothetical protein [Loktanella gaetbuli]SEP82783.1 hypothetical protein SAMN05428995_101925 [Loktanella sp. DSM 29012]